MTANGFIALWLCQAAHSCFGNDSWPEDIPIPQAWLEFDVDSVENATADLESQGYRILVKDKKEPWAKLSHVFSLPKDYWSASLSLLRCGKKNNALCNSNMFFDRSSVAFPQTSFSSKTAEFRRPLIGSG
jgi:hypothetical protein